MAGAEEGVVTVEAYHRRRESDRAEQRAARAAERGDHAAYLMAKAQAQAARQRRDEWMRREAETARS
jgi:hypothetical protein